MSNILITPNVIINSLLPSNRQITERFFFFFFEQTMEFAIRNEHKLYMTEIDYNTIEIYIEYLNKLLNNFRQIEYFTIEKKEELKQNILLTKNYLKHIKKFPVTQNIIDIASEYSGKINPTDAIRLATAIAENFSESDIPIKAIVTWEPLHFCSLTEDYTFARDNWYVEVFAGESENYDIFKPDQITKTIHRKPIYSPIKFMSNQHLNQIRQEYQIYQYEFCLSNLEVITMMNNNSQNNQVSVTIQCIDKKSNKKYEFTSMKRSKKGLISALLLSIYSCIGKIGSKNNLKFSSKSLDKTLVRDIIFAINPAQENNQEIFADVYLRSKNIQATVGANNLIWATANSYIEMIKSWLMEQTRN